MVLLLKTKKCIDAKLRKFWNLRICEFSPRDSYGTLNLILKNNEKIF